MKNDPYWTIGRYGNCRKCGVDVKLAKVFYFPKMGRVYCETCGKEAEARFVADCQCELIR